CKFRRFGDILDEFCFCHASPQMRRIAKLQTNQQSLQDFRWRGVLNLHYQKRSGRGKIDSNSLT
ncbi:MAG: hypothetical protein ABJB61_00295, partial [bacterium]